MKRWLRIRNGWLLALIFIVGLFMAVGCSGGGGGGGGGDDQAKEESPPDDGGPPQPAPASADSVGLYCTSPTYETAFTADSSTITVSGEAVGPVDSIVWDNLTTGESGTADGVASWTATVPLQEGDNEVEITALATDGEEDVTMPLTITYNTSVTFTSLPQLTPDAGFTNVIQDPIYVRIGIDDTDLDASSIKLFQLDFDGAQDTELGTLQDNGNLANGDEIQGDGIYSAKISLTSTYERLIEMRIYASDDQGTPSMSPVFSFVFYDEPEDDALGQQEVVNKQVLDKLDSLIKANMAADQGLTEEAAAIAAIDDLVTYLEGLDSVADAGSGDSAVWWMNELGLQFVIDVNIDRTDELNWGGEYDEWSSDWEDMRMPDEAAWIDLLKTHVTYLKPGDESDLHSTVLPLAEEDKYIVGSHDAVHISPYKELETIFKNFSPSGWADVVKKSDCLSDGEFVNTVGDPMNDPNTGPVPLQRWKELNKYGLISTLTHGTTFKRKKDTAKKFVQKFFSTKYPEILQEVRNKYPGESEAVIQEKAKKATIKYLARRYALTNSWNTVERELFKSNIRIDSAKDKWQGYMKDPQLGPEIMGGRIIPVLKLKIQPALQLIGYDLMITPEFIRFHNKDPFPKSIWFASSCYSAAFLGKSSSMAEVLKQKGGLAYIGFTHVVKAGYALKTQHKVFDEMINQGKTVKEALDAARAAHGVSDADATPAFLKGWGEGLARFDFNVKNPSFEEPDGKGSTNGWTTEGDARSLKKLGGASPTNGGNMAIISSGLGLTTSYGKLSQLACLSTKAKELKFDWNFYSEEFKEYCHRGYDDTFLVTVTEKESGVTKTLFRTSVDTLCQSCNGSDLESAACKNLPLQAAGVSFDRGGVWTTGWKSNQTASLSEYKGKAVTLSFFIEDKGDTAYDTAVLIDNIRIVEE